MHVVMLAAENDALPGGKVGGLGDVIRDLPPALARKGHEVSVITPGYGTLAPPERSRHITDIAVTFASHNESLSLYRVDAPLQYGGVNHWVVEHPLFACAGTGRIYASDDGAPFAMDANKFALFCVAVAELLQQHYLQRTDVLHCHDWHTSLLLILRRYAPRYKYLQPITTVFSIHNLSLQGVRPLRGDASSLESWLPDLDYDPALIVDPRGADCVNFMRAGVNLADRVQTVSPTYAREILQASDGERGFVGGEGLEEDLRRIHREGRLIGILNGCDYQQVIPPAMGRTALLNLMEDTLAQWAERDALVPPSFYHALRRIQQWRKQRRVAAPVLVAIGRLVEQKFGLLRERVDDQLVMDDLLERLNPGIFIVIGSGDARFEQFFTGIMARHANFLFLQGYSDKLAAQLYRSGDLFVMPSSYEPCGISQMLALRAGTPCLVHATGGLKDTVRHLENGFVFEGGSRAEQASQLIAALDLALTTFRSNHQRWLSLCEAARAARFTWDEAADCYLDRFYLTTSRSHADTADAELCDNPAP